MSASDECKKGVNLIGRYLDNISGIMDRNKANAIEYRQLQKIYNEKKKTFETETLTDWENRKDVKQIELNKETKLWKNCVVDAIGKEDQWCENDFGHGWFHDGFDKGGCKDLFAVKRGKCRRTDSKIKKDLHEWETKNPKPIFDQSPPVLVEEKYPQPNNFAINCCQSTLQGGNNKISDSTINQLNKCYAEISDSKKKGSDSKKKGSDNNLYTSLSDDDMYIILGGIFIVLLISSK